MANLHIIWIIHEFKRQAIPGKCEFQQKKKTTFLVLVTLNSVAHILLVLWAKFCCLWTPSTDIPLAPSPFKNETNSLFWRFCKYFPQWFSETFFSFKNCFFLMAKDLHMKKWSHLSLQWWNLLQWDALKCGAFAATPLTLERKRR